MNIFKWLLLKDFLHETRLGMPSRGPDEAVRRAQRMFEMTGGKGFRVHPNEPRTDSQGRTRGQRKRAARDVACMKEAERQRDAFVQIVARGGNAQAARRGFGSL